MKEKIRKVLEKAIKSKEPFDILVPETEAFGHYSTNLALRLAKKLKEDPMRVAERLTFQVKKSAPAGFFSDIRIAKPGFINFWISTAALHQELQAILRNKERYGRSAQGKGKTVIVEHSQPNIAKELHVGHLRTTFIGDALANIFEFLGYKVIRWNYVGDWGTQFGKVIAAYKLWGKRDGVRREPIEELSRLYVKFHEEVKKSPSLEDQAREEFRKLEEGDKENRKLWEWFRSESLRELCKIYELLGVQFTTFIGESFFEGEMKPLVRRLLRAGVAKRSEGSVIIPLEAFKLPPALIEKSDGASLYLTRDIANLTYRIKKWKPKKILYVVGNEQSLHFEQLFAIAKLLKLDGPELVHVKYGLILGEDAKKLATRAGKTVLAKEIVEKAVRLARHIVEKKRDDLSPVEKSAIAEAVGIGALKYNVLHEHHHSDIVFDWDRMLDFSGESGPYLQYTHARLVSICRKAEGVGVPDFSLLLKLEELALIRKIANFPEEVERSGAHHLTNNLAFYLYDLANAANRLYETTPVLKEENAPLRSARLELIRVAAGVLKSGLGLLGIQAPEQI